MHFYSAYTFTADSRSLVAPDEVDERIETPPSPKRPKIAIPRQSTKEGPSAKMTHRRKRRKGIGGYM